MLIVLIFALSAKVLGDLVSPYNISHFQGFFKLNKFTKTMYPFALLRSLSANIYHPKFDAFKSI